MAIGICTILNFAIIVILQVTNIRDFYETMATSHIIIIALILLMGITIILDILKGYIKEYHEVAIGFGGLMFAGVCEICLVYITDTQLNGIALCFGLVLLLFTAGFAHALNNFFFGMKNAGATLTVALYVYAKEQGEFGVAFAIAAILMVLAFIINLSATAVTKHFQKKNAV